MSQMERRRYIQIATTLRYPREIIERLRKATSIAEANRLMKKGREML